jgi:hypothetical protein
MARQKVWVPLGGSSRRFINCRTGQIISRRQYDKRYGNLRRQGYRSYEAKAKAAKQQAPVQAAMRPARGRRAVPVVHTVEEFKKAWSSVVKAKRGTEHVYILIGKARHWQEQLMGKVSRPDIVVDIRMGFVGVNFSQSVVTPYFEFLSDWGTRHYRQFLERKGKPGDRVGVWIGYDFKESAGKNEVITTPVREQPLSILSGEPFAIDEQIVSYFVEMPSIDAIVRGVMLRILLRR